MNILHVVNISFVIPYFLGEQLLYFKEKGYNEHIICSPSKELINLSKKYQFHYNGICILRKISIWKDLKAVVLTANYIRKFRIDIVTGHTPKGALIAMLAGYIMHVPVRIYFRHGLVYETSKGLKRKILIYIDRLAAKLSSKIVNVSSSVSAQALEDRLNLSEKQTLLLKGTCNGIDIDRFSRVNIDNTRLNQLKLDLGLEHADFIIGFTGRLVRDKGVIELVTAFQKLQSKYSNIFLLLVGMLEERDALPPNVVEAIKDNAHIICTGYVKNSIIEYYYALMNLFILPSYREGFPTSVLEASSMSLPIITTKATGCVDSVIENRTGIFVTHSSESIIAAIEGFYTDNKKCLDYGENGRKFVVENFEQHNIWEEIERLYL